MSKSTTILEKTIFSLSKKEIINYKILANKYDAEGDNKSIALFDNIKRRQSYLDNSKTKFVESDSQRKLRTRLLDSIGNSLVHFYFHDNTFSYVFNELSLYHIFLSKNEWDVACFHLECAEKMAVKNEDVNTLNAIYNEFIKLSTYIRHINPKEYIAKRKQNEIKLKSIQILDDAISNIVSELNRSQALVKTTQQRLNVIYDVIKQVDKQKEIKNDFSVKQRLFEAITSALIAQRDFVSLESYCIKTFQEFSRKKIFSKQSHETKLQILRFICNSLFENKKYNLALSYIKIYFIALSEYESYLYNKHLFFYYNSLANIYSITDPHKAIEVLTEAKNNYVIKGHPTHLLYVHWNLAGAYFDTENYKQALKHIVFLKQLDAFESLNKSLKLHIMIFECVIRFELNDKEYIINLQSIVFKNYKTQLDTHQHKRDRTFLLLLKKIVVKDLLSQPVSYQKNISKFAAMHLTNQSSNVINYIEWLNSKI